MRNLSYSSDADEKVEYIRVGPKLDSNIEKFNAITACCQAKSSFSVNRLATSGNRLAIFGISYRDLLRTSPDNIRKSPDNIRKSPDDFL